MKNLAKKLLLALAVLAGAQTQLHAQGTAFTYQGRLNSGGGVVTGSCDFAFSLFATNTTGPVLAGPVTNTAVAVSNGLFTTTLDFGAGVFTGVNYWLDIAVRTSGAAAFTELSPRQALTPVPYAEFANTASNLSGTISAAQLSGTVSNNLLPGFQGSYNTVGGGSGNSASTTYATVGGGQGNAANNTYATVGGGVYNTAGYLATVGGGNNNTASGWYSTVPGGANNTASGNNSLAAGQRAKALHQGAFVWADSQAADFASTTNDQFLIRAQGGVGIGTNVTSGNALTVAGNVAATSFSGNGTGLTKIAATAVGPAGLFSILPVAFQSPETNAVGGDPNSMVAVDINGDGNLDVITANTLDGTLTVLTNNGSGVFGFKATIAVGTALCSLVAADVNGDGKPDLICANQYTNTLMVLTNNGSGGFVLSATLVVGQLPYSVVAADINGDGKVDLISANYKNGTLSILTNNGTGGFALRATISGGQWALSVVAADFNGDGKLDLATATGANKVFVQTNNGQGGFSLSATVDLGATPDYLLAADINGDGKPDLICTLPANNAVMVLINDGLGGFNPGTPLTVGISSPSWVAAADLSGDGRLDLVIANGYENTLTLLTNNGTGGFGYYSTFVVGFEPSVVVAADVNGDGKPDLITALAYDHDISVLLSNPTLIPSMVVLNGNGSGLSGLNTTALNGTLPAAVMPAGLNVDPANQNLGNVYSNALTFGSNSGEGIASKRSGVNPADLEFFTAYTPKMIIQQGGNVGLGVTNPAATLDIASSGTPQLQVAQTASDYARLRLAGYTNAYWDVAALKTLNFFNSSSSLNVLVLNPNGSAVFAGTVTANGVTLTSDRNAKENFTLLNPQAVLAKVAALPVTEWNYKSDDAAQRHIGPMAQDFQAAFQLSDDDKHISVVDEGGVALAAIQGLNQQLNQKLEQKETEIAELKQGLADLKKQIQSLAEKK